MLAERLRELRESRGMSQSDVARRMNERRDRISRWEGGQRAILPGDLTRLLDALRATDHERLVVFRAAGEAKRTVALGDGLTLELEPDDPELQGALARLDEGDDDIDVDGAADATHRPADASDHEVRFVPDASDFADDGESCTPLRAVLSRANLANGGDGHADEGTHAPARRQSAGR